MPKLPESKEGNLFLFSYVHPKTNCLKSGDVIKLSFSAETMHLQTVLAENERVLCDRCGVDYILVNSPK